MELVRAWLVVLGRATSYALYRLGLKKRPELYDIRYELMLVVRQAMRWRKRMRIVDGERCVRRGPAIFAGNHISGVDPFMMFCVAYLASGGRYMPRFMMREGIFSTGSLAKSRLLDLDEIAVLAGSHLISRDQVQLSQLRPFFRILEEEESFIMYPGRTRSRSGLFTEYRGGLDEPGAVSFFLQHVQRRKPEPPVAVVPLTRTYNPATRRSTVVVGEPQYLPAGAGREAQREFDFNLMKVLGDRVEVNAAHTVAALAYLRCLHAHPSEVPAAWFEDGTRRVLEAVRANRCVDPDSLNDAAGQVRRVLRWLAKSGMLERRGASVVLNREAILYAPAPDRDYRRRNPVKYLTNQILHLPDVVAALEEAAGC
jgi:1-acyl-sn-glycerol-3-phosphate acyltransferase